MYFEQVRGHENAKRAIEIALCGNHSILFVGDAGSGKTTLLSLMRTTSEKMNITSRAYYDDILLAYPFPKNLPKLCTATTTRCFCGKFIGEKVCECDMDDLKIANQRIYNMNLAFDIVMEVSNIDPRGLFNRGNLETTDTILKRIDETTNMTRTWKEVKELKNLEETSQILLKHATERLDLKPKHLFQILSIANTIAMMDRAKDIRPEHIAEAIQYKSIISF